MILSDYEPKDVLSFFETLTTIPRESGHTDKIQAYILNFARKRSLWARMDSAGNILVKRPGSAGREKEEPVILQGHIDMVAVKDADSVIDLGKDPLDLYVEGDLLFARGTSLGGDNGIAVAYMLAVLDRQDISTPPVECLFTNDEETGLFGASMVDTSNITGRRLINMDSEDEGIITAGCAGGIRIDCGFKYKPEAVKGTAYIVSIGGLLGGHSGMEIGKDRANAIKLMARVVEALMGKGARLVSMEGGTRDNVIPSSAKAVLVFPEGAAGSDKEGFEAGILGLVKNLEAVLKKEFIYTDPGLFVNVDRFGNGDIEADLKSQCDSAQDLSGQSYVSGNPGTETDYGVVPANVGKNLITFLRMIPNGVQSFCGNIRELPETSANLGVVRWEEGCFTVRSSVRSSVKSRKEDLYNRIMDFAAFLGGDACTEGDYPGWEFLEDSPLREKMCGIFEDMYKKPMVIETIHAGLECGYFSEKLPGLDCVSIGPDVKEVHSTKEHMSLSSVKRVWEYLLRVLEEI